MMPVTLEGKAWSQGFSGALAGRLDAEAPEEGHLIKLHHTALDLIHTTSLLLSCGNLL